MLAPLAIRPSGIPGETDGRTETHRSAFIIASKALTVRQFLVVAANENFF